jgi:hypothetical protein
MLGLPSGPLARTHHHDWLGWVVRTSKIKIRALLRSTMPARKIKAKVHRVLCKNRSPETTAPERERRFLTPSGSPFFPFTIGSRPNAPLTPPRSGMLMLTPAGHIRHFFPPARKREMVSSWKFSAVRSYSFYNTVGSKQLEGYSIRHHWAAHVLFLCGHRTPWPPLTE